jgi:hypothetical protein
MRKQLLLLLAATSSVCLSQLPQPSLGDEIPKIGWRRPLVKCTLCRERTAK